jgi:septum formation topological specificity factor MinE
LRRLQVVIAEEREDPEAFAEPFGRERLATRRQ